MKILFIKMLGVAILFTGLGGIINQINTFFNSAEQLSSLDQRILSTNDTQVAGLEKSIRIVRQGPPEINLQVETRNISGNSFKIERTEETDNPKNDFCLPKIIEDYQSLMPNESAGRKLIIVTGRNEQISNDKTESNEGAQKVFKFERKIEGE